MRRQPLSVPALVSAVVLSGAAVVPLSAAFAAPVAAKETFVPGTGAASASLARVTIRSSGLGVGVGFGQTRTRFAGPQGNASAESVDTGMLGTLSKAPVACGVAPGTLFPEGSMPEGVAVSSGGGPAELRTASVGAGTPIELGSQYGAAKPNARADATVEGTRIDLTGILSAAGGISTATSELRPNVQRAATASSGMSRLSLADGAVVLQGLEWTASHLTGAKNDNSAAFRVGSIRVAGQYYPTEGANELKTALDAANQVLQPLGLSLNAPAVSKTDTLVSVSPLRLTISTTPEMRAVLGPALEAVQPLRTQLLDLVKPLQASPDCGFAKAIGFGYLVADLALIAMGDNGGIDIDLGGARAGTDATVYDNPFGTGDGLGGLLDPTGVAPGVVPPDLGAAPGTGPLAPGAVPTVAGGANLVPTVGEASPLSIACRSTHADGGSCVSERGGLAAGLILALVVLLAAADRLRARLS